ncbi:Secreted protein acidic and rich in cysteine [Araneus ventricosus]|uniref:Secreted protein acidic and rich in cysteine n=1 Tax=Araneus ventricosus TaxID=182803 RepID=A0A4Y2QW82_ARAVE|nr:Secreted protein acidic and rich in cysteine [Araneus ventricosus]
MKFLKLFIFLLIVTAVASKKAHRKKEKKHLLKDTSPEKDILDFLQDDEKDEEEHKKKKHTLENELLLENFDTDKGGYNEDPCLKHKCGPGKQCEIDDNGKAQCVCVPKCAEEDDSRRKACSNHNETWSSDCELYRMRCLCTEGSDECKQHKYKHVHIDYYGPCKDIGECTADELEDFPRRMRDWLFNVMQEMARRDALHGTALKLEKEAEKSQDRRWVNAVIWKFCDLDVHPHDRHVSRHELFPIRAPLMAMEHCVAPFLDSCDVNDDHKITLLEWGNCLGLKEDEIQDKCELMHRG